MDKETLEKANFLVRQAKATKTILERMKKGLTMAVAYMDNGNHKLYDPLLFDKDCEFIHTGVMNLLESYQNYLKQEFEKL